MPPSQQATDRQIRVFISSTFRDMTKERDLLVKQVFPALRRKCASRFVTFTEVDLRWGITEEQANEGQVLPLCLAEIERSRPYFIGLLGERYGWIPDTIRPEVIEREPWLQEHVRERTSVTELEILHGVLNNPKMQGHAFFYFRDPAYVETVPVEERDDYRAENAEAAGKLRALKARIHASGLPLVAPYATPASLAEMVRQQFDALIDQLYPENDIPHAVTQERLAHEAHATNKLFACIERPAHLAVLDEFASMAEHAGKGLVISGESGGGKTALLAAWARRWAISDPEDFLFQHYFGATSESASVDGFLRRLLGELQHRFDITEEIPADPEKLRDALPHWLAQTVRDDHLVLLLDGLNQLQGSDPDRRLAWLPRFFPAHITVIASALPGPALEALRERDWAEHDLPFASETEVAAMVDAYLGLHARDLSADLRQTLVSAPGARSPLYLRTLLEELRQFGSFEELPERIAYYLKAESVRDLFVRVLRRWQEDFDGEFARSATHELVRRALAHLWAARQGLAESEWLEVLGANGEPLPRALWSPFFLALEPHLSQRAGLYAFGHDFLRQAVEMEWLQDVEAQRASHLALADYFESHPQQFEMTSRKAAEWPHQLLNAQVWERLEACLTDIYLFQELYNERTKWELSGYWHPLRAAGRELGECYRDAYTRWAAVPGNAVEPFVPYRLGRFLLDNGVYIAAETLFNHSLAIREKVFGPDHSEVAAVLNGLAVLKHHQGQYGHAASLYKRSLIIMEKALGANHPEVAAVLNNLAGLYHEQGQYAEAKSLYKRSLEIWEQTLGADHPNVAVGLRHLAGLHEHQYYRMQAKELCERSLAIVEKALGPDDPEVALCLDMLARLCRYLEQYTHAEKHCLRALAINEKALGPDHPGVAGSLNNLAVLYYVQGQYAQAEPLGWRSRAILEKALGPNHHRTLQSWQNLADILEKTGKIQESRELRLHRATILADGPVSTPLQLRAIAFEFFRLGDYARADAVFRRVLGMGSELSATHCDLARIALMRNDLPAVREHAANAWAHRAEAPRFIVPRILWLQLAGAMLDGDTSGVAPLLGQLRTTLPRNGATSKWKMEIVLEHLRLQLPPEEHALLTALVDAMSSPRNLAALKQFDAWQVPCHGSRSRRKSR